MSRTPEQIQNDLSRIVSGGRRDVFVDVYSRVAFSTDASMYQIMPLCIVRPRNAQDVAAVVRYAARHGIAVAGRGAGSGLAGESLTSGIVVDASYHLDRILDMGGDGARVVCEPGVVLEELNAALALYGRKIGPDPSSGNRAVIGGIVANNATGAHSLQYGHIADYVESVETVLADGSIVEFTKDYDPSTYDADQAGPVTRYARGVLQILEGHEDVIDEGSPRTERNRSGYNIAGICRQGRVNLARLMAGSEGTLGIFTRITLRTVELPKAKALVQLEFDSLDKMARAVPLIVETQATACELMDRRVMDRALEAYPKYSDIFRNRCAAALMVEHVAETEEEVRRKISHTVWAVGDLASGSLEAFDEDMQQRLWRSRKDAVPLLNREKGDRHPIAFIEDVSVDHHRLHEYVMGLERIGRKYGLSLAFYGHAGDGELHVRPYLDLSRSEDLQRMQRIADEVFELAWSLGGSISGEHADGIVRAGFIRRQYGDRYYELLRRIKDLFDPSGVMNPGKIICDDSDAMIRNLRAERLPVGDRLTRNLHTEENEFRWEMDQCNGCGVCLATKRGTRMCPTFRALGHELASSRGKANIVRGWVTGELTEQQFTAEEFKKVINLCVNCKMCSVECPAGVDISKIVIEARAELGRRRGFTRTENLLVRNRWLSMFSSVFAPVSNLVTAFPPFRWMLEMTVGLDRRRRFPRFERGSFIRRGRRYLARQPKIENPVAKVAYFVDSYANWNDHELGFAVLRTLLHNRIEVIIPDQRPAPLPALVYGDLKTARRELTASVGPLAEAVRQGYTIACSEPSAALCLRDELRLLISTEDARLVGANTVELMSWLADLHRAGKLKTPPTPQAASEGRWYAYHTPCHLTAIHEQGKGIQLLRDVCGTRITDINAGCCGLAGTCGMQRKNRDMSAAIGREMADALKAADTPWAMTECAACRMQIEHLTDKRVVHPIKILAAAYDADGASGPQPVSVPAGSARQS